MEILTPPGQADVTISIRCFHSIVAVLGDQGHDALCAELIKQFDLNKQRLMSNERVTLEYTHEVLTFLEHRGAPEAGLLAGISAQFGTFSTLDYFLASCETTGEMLLHLEHYFPLLVSGLPLFRIDQMDDVRVVLVMPKPEVSITGDRILKEMILGMIMRTMISFGNEQTWPEMIGFPNENLSRELVSYLSKRGIRLIMKTDEYKLCYPVFMLKYRMPFHDPQVQSALKPVMDESLKKFQTTTTLTNKILDIFGKSSELAELSLLNIAPDLHMSQSSLKRKLSEEDTSFSDLLNNFKMNRAMELLTGSNTRLEAVARLVGYADRAPFERAFKSWFGETPTQLRQQFLASKLPVHDIKSSDISAIPASPKICQDLILMTLTDDYSINEVGKLVARDPVLAGKLLGIANSSFYGSRKISNLSQAINQVLGINQVRNLAIAMLSSSQLKTKACPAVKLNVFWAHSMATAEATRAFAKLTGIANEIESGEFYLAALMHNLSELVFAYLRPVETDEYLTLVRDQDFLFDVTQRRKIEKKVFGLSSVQMSALILTHWGLPDTIYKLVRAMETVDLGNDDASLPTSTLALLRSYFRGVVYFPDDEASLALLTSKLATLLKLDNSEVQQRIDTVYNRLDEINSIARQMSG